MTRLEAVAAARAAGFTHVETWAGWVELEAWGSITIVGEYLGGLGRGLGLTESVVWEFDGEYGALLGPTEREVGQLVRPVYALEQKPADFVGVYVGEVQR